MSTSDNSIKKSLIYNLAGTVFLVVFGAIYEYFSHGVYSYFMIYAFAVPLMIGVIPYQIMFIKGHSPSQIYINLWNSAIATLSIGSVFAGVLAIYGTTNRLVYIYPIVGCILSVAGLISLMINKNKTDQAVTAE